MRKDGTASRSGRSTIILGADFETDRKVLPDGSHEGFVCQWAVARARDRSANTLDYTEVHGYTLDGFKEYVYGLMEHSSSKYVIYFHNLNYDIQFMRGFMHELHELCKDDKEPPMELFRDGSPIMLRYRNIEFRDSLKKIPNTTVAQIGAMVGLPKLESPRGNFDIGWSQNPPLDDSEFAYVIHDAAIVALAMKSFHTKGLTHATISGDAWADIRATFNKSHCDMKGSRRYGQWDEYFPQLSVEMDDYCRMAYFGGLNISWIQGSIDGCINHIDRNSMYPSIMAGIASKPSNHIPYLPYGSPIMVPDDVDVQEWCDAQGLPCFIIRGTLKLKLKKGMKPYFKFKHAKDRILEGMGSSEYVTKCDCWHELTLTNVDYDLLCRYYEIKWKPDADFMAIAFHGEAGLFKDYVDKWYAVKKVSKGIDRQEAKLLLNSSYGRFGMSRMMTETAITWNGELGDWGFEGSKYMDEEPKGWIPMACFITAYARWALMDAVDTVGIDNVIHCDTDSVIYIGPKEVAYPLGNTKELGDWGFEPDDRPITGFIEGGVKRYIEFYSDEPKSLDDFTFRCAGVPQKQKDGIPSGMWLEVLDDPSLITATGYQLGKEHYSVKSQWLRDILTNGGKNPDDCDTRKIISGKSTLIKNGMELRMTTYRINDNTRVRF